MGAYDDLPVRGLTTGNDERALIEQRLQEARESLHEVRVSMNAAAIFILEAWRTMDTLNMREGAEFLAELTGMMRDLEGTSRNLRMQVFDDTLQISTMATFCLDHLRDTRRA